MICQARMGLRVFQVKIIGRFADARIQVPRQGLLSKLPGTQNAQNGMSSDQSFALSGHLFFHLRNLHNLRIVIRLSAIKKKRLMQRTRVERPHRHPNIAGEFQKFCGCYYALILSFPGELECHNFTISPSPLCLLSLMKFLFIFL